MEQREIGCRNNLLIILRQNMSCFCWAAVNVKSLVKVHKVELMLENEIEISGSSTRALPHDGKP